MSSNKERELDRIDERNRKVDEMLEHPTQPTQVPYTYGKEQNSVSRETTPLGRDWNAELSSEQPPPPTIEQLVERITPNNLHGEQPPPPEAGLLSQGLSDAAAGRVKPLEKIEAELRPPNLDDPETWKGIGETYNEEVQTEGPLPSPTISRQCLFEGPHSACSIPEECACDCHAKAQAKPPEQPSSASARDSRKEAEECAIEILGEPEGSADQKWADRVVIDAAATKILAFASHQLQHAEQRIAELEKQVSKLRKWVNYGGVETPHVCNSPKEPGHKIYGPYRVNGDGTYTCEFHAFEEQIEQAEAERDQAVKRQRELEQQLADRKEERQQYSIRISNAVGGDISKPNIVRIQELKQQKEAAEKKCKLHLELRIDAEERLEQLEGALEHYGKHDTGCPCIFDMTLCTCGLMALLTPPAAGEEG